MLIVKRVKGDAVHYAALVHHPSGAVERWTSIRDEAVSVPAAVAKKVEAHYASRPTAGTITLESVDGGLDDYDAVTPAPDEAMAKLVEELAAVRANLTTEINENGELKADVEALKSRLGHLMKENEELGTSVRLLTDENKKALADLAALQAELDAANELIEEK